MKRGLLAFIAAVFVAGVGGAQAQALLVEYDNTANYVSNHKDFSQQPTSWKDNLDSQPASGYSGPSFSYAGVGVGTNVLDGTYGLTKARISKQNDPIQLVGQTNYHGMVAFDFPAAAVGRIEINGSTYGPDVTGDDIYLILHDSTQSYENGWYATELHSRTGAAAPFNYDINVGSVTWYQFTPSTVDDVSPLGTIGPAVDSSVIIGATFDEVGYYANVYKDPAGPPAGWASHFLYKLAAYEPAADPSLELGNWAPMNFGETSFAATGTVSAFYTEGAAQTNVTLSSVSVVAQSHSNAFSVANTNLPLTLATPGVAEDLFIAFDNTTAGLTEGQTATGLVEIVWNEEGSATSTTTNVPVSATYLGVNDSNIIALFNDSFNDADRELAGLVAKISGGHGVDNTRGSNDGSYGTLPGAAPTAGGALSVRSGSYNKLNPVIQISNNTGSDIVLDSLNFDVIKRFELTPGAVDVSIFGDVTFTNLLDSTVATNFTVSDVKLTDYDDFDVPLNHLPDHTLAHGESLSIKFAFVDLGGTSDTLLDNIAVLGTGLNGAVLSTEPDGPVIMGVASFDTTVSEPVNLSYTEGDAATNIVFNSVSFTNESHAGAFSAFGLVAGISTPETIEQAVTVAFDNTVGNLAAGEVAEATLLLSWNEAGLGERVHEVTVYAARPAATDAGVVALFDTEFLYPDAAIDGVSGKIVGGSGPVTFSGSNDGTYGTLASPEAPTNTIAAYKANRTTASDDVVTLTVTNKSTEDIVLSSLNFDVGRGWGGAPNSFTLSVSGDVTADPALLEVSGLTAIGSIADFTDFDVPLTNLTDRVLGTGESVVFTFTFPVKAGVTTSIDNIALLTLGGYANWSSSYGLTEGVNDAPTDNPDGDSMNNLMEYATGCDPLTPDSAATLMQAEEGGTNWFYHVHAERTDDPSLTFTVGSTENLVHNPATNAVSFVGESAVVDHYKTVTNRTDIKEGVPSEFIRLEVEQN